MSYPAAAIANYFIQHAVERGEYLTPMKLQKLVYFAHGWHLALTDGEALIDESIQAWEYGPVVPSLFHEFKEFGARPIMRKANQTSGSFPILEYQEPEVRQDDEAVRTLLRRVWDIYGSRSAADLSALTHLPGTPWDRALKENPGGLPKHFDLPDQWINEYFSEKLDEPKANPQEAAGPQGSK